ncbi:aspartic peptidase domain-containing protein [Absidia repens]|uniref:rhizopuspepsin n=1 Tax=Absidia repens TaxID=90262 RepID=A0A1X2I3I7_9FUNG|nr:aspartic peptidase domain-containing protein [Absidia repens]
MPLYFILLWCSIYVCGLVIGSSTDGVHVIPLKSYRASSIPASVASKLITEETAEGGEEPSEVDNSIPSLPADTYGSGSSKINSFKDVLWYTTITIGTGEGQQQLTVDVDTGSADLFIPGSMCGASCNGHNTYDPTKSATSEESINSFGLSFADESYVNGTVYRDTVSLGGLVVEKQAFGVATVYSQQMKKDTFAPDGLFGLGFASLSHIGMTPLLDNLYNQRKIKARIFGIRLDRSGADGEQGELTLGGYNEQHVQGKIVYAPVTDAKFWQIELDYVSVGKRLLASRQKFVVDTGSTLINANEVFVKNLYSSIPGARRLANSKYWTVPKAKIPVLVLTIGGTQFTIDPSNFCTGPDNDSADGTDRCYGGIVADVEPNAPWIVGGIFLKNVYSIFDMDQKRIGFSQLKNIQPTDQ